MLNSTTKFIGVAVLVVLAMVMANWPKGKEVTKDEVAKEVATVSVNMADKVAKAGADVVGNLRQPSAVSEPAATKAEEEKKAEPVNESTDTAAFGKEEQKAGKTEVKFANKTVLPEAPALQEDRAPLAAKAKVNTLLPGNAIKAEPVVVPEPNQAQYQSAQKRLAQVSSELDAIINGAHGR